MWRRASPVALYPDRCIKFSGDGGAEEERTPPSGPGESSSRGRTGAGLPRHEDNEDNSLPPGGFGMNAWRRASPMIAIEENASTWADTGIDRTS
ncbi:hypothetical protein OPV22_026264 [Ensete ventricosum]|uniref:Uncharacterized protein n=1 Tax=Ensete ventricosum TaxID=4639 RepID=A0AAV8Q9Q7_ENSVE|nr:hypothetical protein OPV22_026264 [Ensete ventricosum]